MDYLWLKALHIVAVVTWIGGMLVVAVTITAASGRRVQQKTETHSALEAVRRWDQRVTSPAMILVWILGITLARTGNWFPQRWLLVKLVFVLLLSALHGVLSGRLRRLSRSQQSSPPRSLRYAAAVLVATFVIVILVVTKPI